MRIIKIVAAATFAVSPIAVTAQEAATVDSTTTTTPIREDNEFPWGLLGLLGLAGLIPRKQQHTTAHTDRATAR